MDSPTPYKLSPRQSKRRSTRLSTLYSIEGICSSILSDAKLERESHKHALRLILTIAQKELHQ